MERKLCRKMLQEVSAASVSPQMTKRKGTFLVEASIALFLLVAISFVLLNGSLNILQPRIAVMQQSLVDAYLTQEVAYMNRIDFDAIADGTSPWGDGTLVTVGTTQMGRLPGFTEGVNNGRPFNATVYRVRIPLETSTAIPSFQVASGSSVFALQDLGVRAYKLQSHVVYSTGVGATNYARTRTVIRSQ